MSVPLALSAPMAAAGLAYLNVKMGFWYDQQMLRAAFPTFFRNFSREWRDRCNTFYVLEQRATNKSSANRPFILYQDRSWTFAQVYEMALKYGTWLRQKYDIKARDIVAMSMQNSDDFVFLCFGLWSIGAKPAFINYNLTGEALAHCVNTAKAAMMLVDAEIAKNVDDVAREKMEGLRIEFLTDELKAEIVATDPVRPPDSLRTGEAATDMAILIYTSGTTGLPKAAIVPWGKLTLAGTFVGGWLGTTTSDVFYTSMPLYHSSAMLMGLMQCLEMGATFAIGKKFSTKTFWKEARQYQATMIQYVGETCRYLLAAPPETDPATGENLDKKHRIRIAFGNGLRPDVWDRFRERFGIEFIAEFYGATEGNLPLFNLTRNEFASGAIGRGGFLFYQLFKPRLAIVARDDETGALKRDPKTGLCIEVPRGDVGETLSALPGGEKTREFQGYYNNPAATESKMVRDVRRKGDLYFRTGDLMSWDAEGRLYFHDRIGDTFRWKGENVATTEVGAVMGRHDAVHDVNVYGVQLPHHDGRAGCAAVTLAQPPDAELLQSLAKHAKAKLPKYAVPIFLRVGKGLAAAVTGTNKQQKNILRAQGVDPAKVGDDELFWLKKGTYVKFEQSDWDRLNAGRVKL
ncbi:acetyl-CoA synthetase-like protein [Xylariaceae sp. FL0662B]|nr:acetyl-CoA synthetase-like protein [Xylariaceae sp. FL0662B]